MHGLIIATYVLKAQRQNALYCEDYLADHAEASRHARRILASLATGVAGLAACFIAIGIFG